ncbi:hypothetical protein F511_26877 [Dorcoceras hygrometricum]|uniref:Uncharacterized protein n=1 Tax=Dorcoceras hygrometricum TaxID=472368 RepID=A0A2Z7BDM6_9LAMI|nr:hypothetical protein F511_26877 [Dorcoceras hygrometricum]
MASSTDSVVRSTVESVDSTPASPEVREPMLPDRSELGNGLGREVIHRLNRARRDMNHTRKHFDETLEQCTELEMQLADLEAARAQEERAAEAQREALEAQGRKLVAEKAALVTEKEALATEKEALAAEKEALAAEKRAMGAELDAMLSKKTAMSSRGFVEDERQYRAPHLPAGLLLAAMRRVESYHALMSFGNNRSSNLFMLCYICPLAGSQHTAAPPQGRSGGSSRGRSFPVPQQRMGETQHRSLQQPGPSRFG